MSDKTGHARLPSERGMEKIVRVLLYTGHLPVSSVKALRGACKSLTATIAEHLPRTFLYDVRLEDDQAPVSDMANCQFEPTQPTIRDRELDRCRHARRFVKSRL